MIRVYSGLVRAFTIRAHEEALDLAVSEVDAHPVDADDVLVEVYFSGVNFKDAMVAEPASRVRRVSDLVGGVDAAGVVAESRVPGLEPGTPVAVHGGDLGVARDGGFAEYVYAPARYLSPLAGALSPRTAMIIGTAGVSAMASVLALEDHGVDPDGEILVTGATGGVGSMAVTLLAARGYRVAASTGSPEQADWLRERGASRVISRDEVGDRPGRVLGSELWAGAIDCIGGETLSNVVRTLRYGAAVSATGLVAGADLVTTVYPFITRNVALLGIDVVESPPATRQRVWTALAALVPTIDLDPLVDSVIPLEGIPAALETVRRGATRGRILVDPTARARS